MVPMLRSGLSTEQTRRFRSQEPTTASTLVQVRILSIYLDRPCEHDRWADPASGVSMKIWQCYDNLPAQAWYYTGDNRIAVTGTGKFLFLLAIVSYWLATSRPMPWSYQWCWDQLKCYANLGLHYERCEPDLDFIIRLWVGSALTVDVSTYAAQSRSTDGQTSNIVFGHFTSYFLYYVRSTMT